MECFFVYGVGVDYSPTDKNYEKSQHILRVHHFKTEASPKFLNFWLLIPLLFFLYYYFLFPSLGWVRIHLKWRQEKNDHQGNLGSLKSLLIGHGKRSHPFPRFVEREKRGLAIDRYTMGVR